MHARLWFMLCAAGATIGAAVAATPTPGRLANFSARGFVGGDTDPLIAGLVLTGNKPVLARAIGPTLADFGVPAPLARPALVMHTEPPLVTAVSSPAFIAEVAARVGAFATPGGSADVGIHFDLHAGASTFVATGENGATGNALVELYDAGGPVNSRIANFSARARVGGAAGPLIAGFVIDGGLPRRVLIRAVGPSLATALPGAIADPQLALFRHGATTPLLTNDNWTGHATLKAAFVATGAFALAADNSRDAALVATLEPGSYTVQVTGTGTASGLVLAEIYDATPAISGAPTIAAQPRSLTLPAGASASLTVVAGAGSPIAYQWYRDGVAIPGATTESLTFTHVQPVVAPAQPASLGNFTVTLTNASGSVTSAPATIVVDAPRGGLPPAKEFDLVGFATLGSGTTGGGALAPGDPNYRVLDASVANRAQQLRTWLESTTALVIDVQVDVDLGALNNVGNRPRTNPELVASGLGAINVRSNKTLFSSTGATLRHGLLNISGQNNIIVRNLRFRGLWEFDEGSQNAPDLSPWGYKIQDWDYLTIQNGARNVWVDHCDFEKSYDGIADVKAAADLVTFSWCRMGGDNEGAVERQVAYLEKLYQGQLTDSRIDFTFYRGLRDGAYAAQGIPRQSVSDIIAHELPHDKGNLIGSSDTATGDIGFLNVTFHHIYYRAVRQRLPRMRFGNAHVFNLFVDNSLLTDGTNMGTATTCDAAVFAENNYYFEIADPFPPQSGTSPPGRLAQSGSTWIYQRVDRTPLLTPLAYPFLKDPATWSWNQATRNFTWSVAPAPNARALPYSYAADPVDFTLTNRNRVGVIVPTNAADQATLASYLIRTTQ